MTSTVSIPGLYTLTVFKNILGLILQILLNLEVFRGITTLVWLNSRVQPPGSCASNLKKTWRKRERMFLRIVGEYIDLKIIPI